MNSCPDTVHPHGLHGASNPESLLLALPSPAAYSRSLLIEATCKPIRVRVLAGIAKHSDPGRTHKEATDGMKTTLPAWIQALHTLPAAFAKTSLNDSRLCRPGHQQNPSCHLCCKETVRWRDMEMDFKIPMHACRVFGILPCFMSLKYIHAAVSDDELLPWKTSRKLRVFR